MLQWRCRHRIFGCISIFNVFNLFRLRLGGCAPSSISSMRIKDNSVITLHIVSKWMESTQSSKINFCKPEKSDRFFSSASRKFLFFNSSQWISKLSSVPWQYWVIDRIIRLSRRIRLFSRDIKRIALISGPKLCKKSCAVSLSSWYNVTRRFHFDTKTISADSFRSGTSATLPRSIHGKFFRISTLQSLFIVSKFVTKAGSVPELFVCSALVEYSYRKKC